MMLEKPVPLPVPQSPCALACQAHCDFGHAPVWTLAGEPSEGCNAETSSSRITGSEIRAEKQLCEVVLPSGGVCILYNGL